MTEKTKEWSELWLESQQEIASMRLQIVERDVKIAELERELSWALTGDLPTRTTDSAIVCRVCSHEFHPMNGTTCPVCDRDNDPVCCHTFAKHGTHSVGCNASACLGGAPHWWGINADTGLPECHLCHKSPDASAKESL